ncbi:alpha/beta fold hydrolase [Sphingomonas aerolata]|uniref:alpha/beta fold hydrolase n=1 Tax=Sphingomonas aerolata TaxID=185951 RepID=UPI003A5C2FAE
MAAYENLYWWSRDGLRLHARDYPGGGDGRPPILCLPGLTRNARDFDALAARLAGRWRLIAIDLRGRGESAYAKDPMSYVPLTYVQDVEALLAEHGIDRFVAFGTSLGGIVTMLMAGPARGRDRSRAAQRCRTRDRRAGPVADPRLCRQGERLSDLDARRALRVGEQCRRLS